MRMFRVLMVVAAVVAVGCGGDKPAVAPQAPAPLKPATVGADDKVAATGKINPRLLRRFKVLAGEKPGPSYTPEAVTLGRMLWFDKRLSKGGEVSCNSCHTLAEYGVDGKATSVGVHGQVGKRNSPTVYNASEHFAMFWDGRAADVEEQATGPITNPAEMAMTETEVVTTLRDIPGYVDLFAKAFPGEPISLRNVGRAIAAFERGLTTRSRWDDYLAGKDDALTGAEVDGLRVFLNVGCMGCHTGPQVGASMFQVAGFVEPWPNQNDKGRVEVTKAASDRMVFKVPTLKNITETAPYFHDGSGRTLPEAVKMMGRHQLGIDLSESEVASIVTFLGALRGEIDTAYIAKPALPAGPKASLELKPAPGRGNF